MNLYFKYNVNDTGYFSSTRYSPGGRSLIRLKASFGLTSL